MTRKKISFKFMSTCSYPATHKAVAALMMTTVMVLLLITPASMALTASAQELTTAASVDTPSPKEACNCVIFRLDDVQDYWLVPVQAAIIDKFIEKNASLDMALIMNWVGNDPALVSKLREASLSQQNSSLIEMSLHGWNHVDYGKLSLGQQYDTLKAANARMQDLFGRKSAILVMPFNSYNEDTLKAMNQLGLRIISAEFDTEIESIYNPDEPDSPDNKIYRATTATATTIPKGQDANNSESGVGGDGSLDDDIKDQYGIYHLPQAVGFYTYDSEIPTKTPLALIEEKIGSTIASYGYAVVTLHPQDFTVKNADNSPTKDLSQKEIDDLGILIDWIKQNNHTIRTFSDATKVPLFPIVDNVAPSINAPMDKAVVSSSPLTHVDLGFPTLSDNVDPHPVAINNAPAVGFPRGTTKVIWTAADDAGNAANATQYVTVALVADKTRPTVTIDAPANTTAIKGSAPIANIPVKGTAFDDESGVKVIEVRTNDTDYKVAKQEGEGGGDGWSNWSASVTVKHPGITEIIARATDFFGNHQWRTIQVQVSLNGTAATTTGNGKA
ncbi:putative xylanase/chitin deacetylase [Candidatus Nitrososphaera evergladensis SR1]|uniref:Putative xylanase/chitin deacetylase n=1 Tax=Candidatus Nitrososphaera evergladensis SR1 TaxID=1459636 RepID=A0A075MSE3_9ARCH|nr:polysaccharide deacetylase family protein [Candidatus Nitrososphaera evergladensis]AIF82264.1 putative xylanase/chitin deacetylase [Candidatus Nitrososphaera evergladensis SR1]